jgi:uncharacterized protein (TIGR00266 family)
MSKFTITGEFDPFIHISMQQGEKIFCESGAMVTMDATLDLKGKMNGGFLSALARKFTNGESFFQQHIEANRGPGDVLLAPTLPGSLEILEIGSKQYVLNDGAFVASTSSVDLKVKMQNIGQALFGGTGGFFVMETSGSGQLVVAGFGSIFGLDVTAGSDVIVDNAHVIAWDSNLSYKLTLSTSQDGGFLGNMINSVTSGEGISNRFSGNGKVYVCSRNSSAFTAWVGSKIIIPDRSGGGGFHMNNSNSSGGSLTDGIANVFRQGL